jgi:hypothetical protein
MQEVLPGIFHWVSVHPRIGVEVSSYWLEEQGVLFDPLVPAQGLEWFAARSSEPAAVLLSNRHHYRDSARFAERFGCEVWCNQAGLGEFTHGEQVNGFAAGQKLPGGVIACEVGAICPDDSALHVPWARALAFADGLVKGSPHGESELGFVPDSLMDDPPATKRGLLAAFRRLADELDFEHLLLAHGGPVLDDGRKQLVELIDCGGRTAFEM